MKRTAVRPDGTAKALIVLLKMGTTPSMDSYRRFATDRGACKYWTAPMAYDKKMTAAPSMQEEQDLPPVVSRQEWQANLHELVRQEKAATIARQALAAARRRSTCSCTMTARSPGPIASTDLRLRRLARSGPYLS